jgi:CheY-like chemotaxis protein
VDSSGVKILVAEDNPVSLKAVDMVLRKAGHEIVTAVDGRAALECLQQPDAPQVAVLDWMMPGLDGVEICRRLRAQTPRPVVYLLLLTSKSNPEDIIEGLRAGADDFLCKPFNPSELRARLGVGQRIVRLYNDLAENVRELQTALHERKLAEERLRRSEHHLRMVMDGVPAGVLVCDGQTGKILDSNPMAQRCLGLAPTKLHGQSFHGFFTDHQGGRTTALPIDPAGADCRMISPHGPGIDVRLTQAQVRFEERDWRLLSFLDVSDTRRLLMEQQLNLDQARKLLTIANSGIPRWIGLNDDLTLHLASYSASSQRAGGDHCWARTVSRPGSGPATFLGLRDQSGHEVNCILRSITTDLFHREALENGLGLEDQLAHVNERLCASGMFADDDFLTGLTLELEHATLRLRYVSCGHPPMFLIRQAEVLALPTSQGPGRNLPLGSLPGLQFTAGEHQLLPGDRLLLLTDGLLELGKVGRGSLRSLDEVEEIIRRILAQTPDLPVRQLLRQVVAAAEGPWSHQSGDAPPDDVTVLGVELESDAGGDQLVFHPAGLSELDQAVQETCQQLLSQWGIAPAASPRIQLLLDEALANAWLHGNRRNSRLPIQVRWRKHNGYSVVVEDAGNGFDPACVPDPRSGTARALERGRGVFLIRNGCEWVQWKKGGTRLTMRLAGPDL